jgi:hypothetical protein
MCEKDGGYDDGGMIYVSSRYIIFVKLIITITIIAMTTDPSQTAFYC